jgi:hypothetical protein
MILSTCHARTRPHVKQVLCQGASPLWHVLWLSRVGSEDRGFTPPRRRESSLFGHCSVLRTRQPGVLC